MTVQPTFSSRNPGCLTSSLFRRMFTFLPILALLSIVLASPSVVYTQEEEPPAEPPGLVMEDTAAVLAEAEETASGFVESLNENLNAALGGVNNQLFKYLFFPVNFWQEDERAQFPFIVGVLIFGGLFFTVWFGFFNLRGIKHSINVIRGKYDNPEDEGEISHFRALTSALSATVGLGNIAGVAVAIQVGGPGAVFWMTLAGFLGMSSKFTECTLGVMFRKTNPDGTISGGPMYYLSEGLRQMNPMMGLLGKVLAIVFSFLVMGAALGGGNMFQANQAFESVQYVFGVEQKANWIFGIVMAFFVGLVVIGGIKRIGAATARIVPIMAAVYVLGALVVLGAHFTQIPAAFWTIISMAFTDEAAYGGIVGVLIQGFRRAAFSNEAGLGSAAIAHSAARTKEPAREGAVALMEPFIDTIIICNMTALVIVITGVWNDPDVVIPGGFNTGVALTKSAFETVISWFPMVLVACVVLFAYSTMISWCYYGERGWIYLLDHLGEGAGVRSVIVFRIVFVLFVYIGTIQSFDAVVDFADIMLLSMAFPNILGAIILAPLVSRHLKDYWKRYQGGEFTTTR